MHHVRRLAAGVVAALLLAGLLTATPADAAEVTEGEFQLEIHGNGLDYVVDTNALTDVETRQACFSPYPLPTTCIHFSSGGTWVYESQGGGYATVNLSRIGNLIALMVINDPGMGISETVFASFLVGPGVEVEVPFYPWGDYNAMNGCEHLGFPQAPSGPNISQEAIDLFNYLNPQPVGVRVVNGTTELVDLTFNGDTAACEQISAGGPF